MGTVYLAVQLSLGRRVALKVLPGAQALEPENVIRFRREARAIARLAHPNIVPVHMIGEEDGVHFIVMDFVDGRSLSDIIGELSDRRSDATRVAGLGGPAHGMAVARIGMRVAEALHSAHGEGIIHRDVKPSNVLLTGDGTPLLIDFGIARDAASTSMTGAGHFVGSLFYSSPEQVSGAPSEIDHRTDIYSLGATLYELLALRPYMRVSSTRELLSRIPLVEPPPLRGGPFPVPKVLETVVLHAMEKDRSRRYATARDFAGDLRRFVDGEPVLARPVGPITRLTLKARRRPVMTAALFLFFLLLVVGAYAIRLTGREEQRRRDVAVTELVEEAGAYANFGYPAHAIKLLDRALSIDAGNLDALLHRGLAHADMSRSDRNAANDLAAVISRAPDTWAAAFRLGDLAKRLGDEGLRRTALDAIGVRRPTKAIDFYLEARAKRDTDPRAALELARQAEELDPRNLANLQLIAWLCHRTGDRTRLYAATRATVALKPRAWWALFDLAVAEFQNGWLEEAVRHYGEAVKSCPGDAHEAYQVRLRRQFAGALLAVRRFDEAEREARTAVEIDERSSEAWDTLGVVLMARGRADEAKASLDEALGLDEGNALARAHRARILIATDPSAGLRESERAVASERSGERQLAELWAVLGEARKACEDADGALQAFRRAVEIEPTHATAVLGTLDLLVARGDTAEAGSVAVRAVSHPEARSDLLCRLAGWFLDALREPARALDCARRAIEREPTSAEAFIALARAARAVSDLSDDPSTIEAARLELSRAAPRLSDDPALLRRMDRALADLDDPILAEAVFRRGLAENPDRALLWDRLGRLLRTECRFGDSTEAFEEACEREPANYRRHGSLADAYYMEGRFADALSGYERALAMEPRETRIRVNRACALHLVGRRDEAVDDLEKIVEADPGLLLARLTLGFFLLGTDPARSRDLLEGAARSAPADARLKAYLSMACEALGDAAGASAHLAAAYAAGFRAPDPDAVDGRSEDPRWLARLRGVLTTHRPDKVAASADAALLCASRLGSVPPDLARAGDAVDLASSLEGPHDPESLRRLARACRQLGRRDEARRLCEEALLRPGLPRALRGEVEAIRRWADPAAR